MKMIFRAFGPDFKKNFLAEPFDSVSIYPLMCKLLGVVPEANNGSLSDTKGMLVDNVDVGKHIWFDSQKGFYSKWPLLSNYLFFLPVWILRMFSNQLTPFLLAGGSCGRINVSFTLLILMIVILTFIWRDLPNYLFIGISKPWMHLNYHLNDY